MGNGCGNSANSNGGSLTTTGTASISNDSLILMASMTPGGGALFFEGTSFDYAQTVAGDGLSCVTGNLQRVGVKTGSNSQYPESGDLSVSKATAITAPGMRAYQVWYRDPASFCTNSTVSMSNALEILWLP